MKVKFVYRILPAFIFYTNRFVRKGGLAFGPFIFIRPKYRNDGGLLEHELTHVKQFYRSLGFFLLGYYLSWKCRLKAEIEAYAVQLKFPPASENPEIYRKLYARFIATTYKIPISEKEAERLLLEEVT